MFCHISITAIGFKSLQLYCFLFLFLFFFVVQSWPLLVGQQNHNHVSKLDWHAAYVPQLADEEDLREDECVSDAPAEKAALDCAMWWVWDGMRWYGMSWDAGMRLKLNGPGCGMGIGAGECLREWTDNAQCHLPVRQRIWTVGISCDKTLKILTAGKGFSAHWRFCLVCFLFFIIWQTHFPNAQKILTQLCWCLG